MKLFTKSLIMGLIVTVLFYMLPFTSQCESLSNELFRLHILANSDAEYDQELKLKVRDKILEYTDGLYDNCETKEETIEVTKEHLNDILTVAQKEVFSNGYNYTVRGEITNMYFNTRTYSKFTIPSGQYDALRITIGEGEGHNWWCVMYPSFCMGESSDLENSNLADKEKELISGDDYKIKFQVMEWFEKLKELF